MIKSKKILLRFIFFLMIGIILFNNYFIFASSSLELIISHPSQESVSEGGTITYHLYYSGVSQSDGDIVDPEGLIRLNGFSASISISGNFDDKIVTLSNIKNIGSNYNNKTITIGAGSAIDRNNNHLDERTSKYVFNINKPSSSNNNNGGNSGNNNNNSSNNDNNTSNNNNNGGNNNNSSSNNSTANTTNTYIQKNNIYKESISGLISTNNSQNSSSNNENNNNSNQNNEQNENVVITNCYDPSDAKINTDIDTFSSWLRTQNSNASLVQQNNYASNGSEMIYIVEYYNGSKSMISNANFKLTIPENVSIVNIGNNGSISSQDGQSTTIEWNLTNIDVGKIDKTYVKVKFGSDEILQKSSDISRNFYVRLENDADGNKTYSYIKQLFIDTNVSKMGTLSSYKLGVDPTNISRLDDKITKSEFIKMLADTGILKLDYNSDKYKTFTDYKTTPIYARDAVSSIIGANIVPVYSNNLFRPNNPIIMDDFLQMVTNASVYQSEQKYTVNKPLYTYDNLIKNSDGSISQYKDYIMELVRQNVIDPNEKLSLDSYVTRKEALKIINALSFRGPFENTITNYQMTLLGKGNNLYFYNITNLLHEYHYTYTSNLLQKVN